MFEPDNQLISYARREAFRYQQLMHKGNQLSDIRLRKYAIKGICKHKLVYSLASSCNQLRADQPAYSKVFEEKRSQPFLAKSVRLPTLQQKQT